MTAILTAAQMRWADQYAIGELGISGHALMDRAGRAVAEAVCARLPRGGRVVIVAGPGNNGGDGFAAARWLLRQGVAVQLLLLGRREQLKGDAAAHADETVRLGLEVSECSDAGALERQRQFLGSAGMIVDAIFGTGLDRPLTGVAAAAASMINATSVPVLAVDIASGINSDNGHILGAAVRADWSLPIAADKWGHWLNLGREHAGRLLPPADIGIPASVIEQAQEQVPGPARSARVFSRSDIAQAFPQPERTAHKKDFGHVWIFGGSKGYTGAPRLAAMGAFAVGSGMVSIACPEEVYAIIAGSSLEVMVHPQDTAPWQAADALLAGPGWGMGQQQKLNELLANDAPLVLDADALNMLAADVVPVAAVVERSATTVLTPHPGEAGRLLGVTAAEVQSDRLGAALKLTQRFKSWVVLKGADSLVASPDGDVCVCPFGSPRLATAGTGDVLAGMIAALFARRIPAATAVSTAVALHALAGERRDWYLAGELARGVRDMLAEMTVTPVALVHGGE